MTTQTTEPTEHTDNIEIEVSDENASTELATTGANDPYSMAYMAKILPHMQASLAKTRRVEPGEFERALAPLTPSYRTKFDALVASLQSENEFMDSSQEGLSVNMLKIDQGAGDDPAKPGNSVKGAIYAKPSGKLLTVTPQFAKTLALPTALKVYVLAQYNGRMFFAPKGPDGKPIPPPGVELRGNAPICVSHDRKVGSHYDECRACPYRPFANGSADRNGCKDDVSLFVIRTDLSEIFRIPVSATSFKTCTNVIEQKVKGTVSKKPWELTFNLTTSKVTRPGQEYYVWSASLDTDDDPNGTPTPLELRPLLELFARQIRTELHLPALAASYASAKNKTGPSGEGAAAADTASILKAADQMDYSTSGSSGTV